MVEIIFLGGHINPAITLAMCILGRCKWVLLLVYWAAQYLGAFMGSALLYGAYKGTVSIFGF